MDFQLRINLDNDDATQRGPDALAGYLRDVASRVQGGVGNGIVRDLNGNKIGEYDITDSPPVTPGPDRVRMRNHKTFSHGLNPGSEEDVNCRACIAESTEGKTPDIT